MTEYSETNTNINKDVNILTRIPQNGRKMNFITIQRSEIKMNKHDDMKKCPRCMRMDSASQRFCVHCNTELFFERRFENINEEKVNTPTITWSEKIKMMFRPKL